MAENADEIRQLLDDPNVTLETKKALLYELAQRNGFDFDEVADYERQLGLPVGMTEQVERGTMGLLGASDEQVAAAHREHDLGQSWTNLNDSTPSPRSDDILNDGIVGLRIFDEFYPRYTKAGGDPGGVPAGGDVGTAGLDPDSLRASVDELRDIDFTAFSADAESMDTVAKGVDDSRNHLAQAWANNLAGWTGGAAQAANQYKAKFDGAVATLDEGIKPVPGAITTASNTIQTQVTDYAKLLHNQWGDGKMAQMTPEEVDAMLDARDKLPGVIQQMQEAIDKLNNRSWLETAFDFVISIALPVVGIATVLGIEFAKEITEDNINEELQKAKTALQNAQTKLQQFVQAYATKASSVHEQTQACCQAVQETYDALMKATTGTGKLAQDPFAAIGGTPDFENADHTGNGKGKGKTEESGGKKTTPSNHSGGGDHNQTESPPQTQGPPQHESPPETQQPPQQTDPNQHDPTGDGLAKPPGQPETVEIKDGDRTISVTSPDGSGHVKVTVDDGSGKPKTYDLDFGAPTSPTGQNGQTGPLDQAHTLPAPADGQHTGQPVIDPATGKPVIDPVTGQPVTDAGTPVHAGADGRCVIQDGQLTITAEHPPGQPDTVKVTIDDGSGKPPTTYTLDYSQPGQPTTAKNLPDIPMTAGPGAPDERPAPYTGPGPIQGQVGQEQPASLVGHGPAQVMESHLPIPDIAKDIPPPPVAVAGAPPVDPHSLGFDLPPQETAAQSSVAGGSDYVAGGYGGASPGGQAGSFGAPDGGFDQGHHAGGSGEAGLASVTDGGGDSGSQSGQLGAAGSGGMPMMGGMGAGGGGGGDQDRTAGVWRTVGDLFDDDLPDAEASLGRVTSDERGYGR